LATNVPQGGSFFGHEGTKTQRHEVFFVSRKARKGAKSARWKMFPTTNNKQQTTNKVGNDASIRTKSQPLELIEPIEPFEPLKSLN